MHILYFNPFAPNYEQFVQNNSFNSISQSSLWGQLQNQVPTRGQSWQFGVVNEQKEIIASILLIRHKLGKKRSYLYAHRGPLFALNKQEGELINEAAFDLILKECQKIAKKEQALFIRFDTEINLNFWITQKGLDYNNIDREEQLASFFNFYETFFQRKKFVPAHLQYQPLSSLKINLQLSEEDILKQMKPKGRYNIKVAQKKGVEIKRTNDPTSPAFDQFYELTKVTTTRDAFSAHQKGYYQNILENLGKNDNARLYYAVYEEKIIAAAITTFYGQTGIYYYGASGNEHRNVMAPFLLQWQMMIDAKSKGCQWYDFLGVTPSVYPYKNKWIVNLINNKKSFSTKKEAEKYCQNEHTYKGITQFKTRFGGLKFDYIGAREYVTRPLEYKGLMMVKKARQWLRKVGIRI